MANTNWKYKSEPFNEWKDIGPHEGYISGWFGEDYTSPRVLSELWTDKEGVFLFLKMTNDEDADVKASQEDEDLETPLITKLLQYLQQPIYAQVRFLWVENPQSPVNQWRTNSISVDEPKGDGRVSSLSFLDIRNYSFSIAKGMNVKLEDDGEDDQENTLYKFIFSNETNNKRGFEFSIGYGHHNLNNTNDKSVLGDIVTMYMHGKLLGCLEFNLNLKKVINNNEETVSFSYPSLSQLDIGLRIFFRDPEFPESGNSFYLASHRYPIIDETHPLIDEKPLPSDEVAPVLDDSHYLYNEINPLLGGDSKLHRAFKYYPDALPFKVRLDLLYPLEAERTHFIFKTINGFGENTGLPSSYRTNLGYRVHLIPIEEKSRLQFAIRPALFSDKNSDTAPLYLIPAGDFNIQVPNYHGDASIDIKAVANVDCGISGVEYIKLNSEPAATFTFIPDQAAYAPSHVSVKALLRDFPIIYEAKTKDVLASDTTDQDAPIANKRKDLNIMNETDDGSLDYIEIIKRDYFPVGFKFTDSHSAEYNQLERVEELVTWLQNTLISSGSGNGELSNEATTSWVYITQGIGAVYYAQPEQAILYKAEGSSSDFLDFLEIPSVGLPIEPGENTPLAFPMLPYGDVDPYALTDLRLLEVSLINNFRRKLIQQISAEEDDGNVTPLISEDDKVTPPISEEKKEPKPTGTSPQGLIAKFSSDYQTIERLELGRDTSEPTPKVIPFVDIKHRSYLKSALQSNQLFMVVSHPDSISKNFAADLMDSIDTTSIDIKKWIFELGTESWNKFNRNTILIFKFHDKPLIELAARPELWSFPEHFTNSNELADSATILSLLYDAIEIGNRDDPKESGKYEVLAQAATQANWTGILVLNAHVPPGGLPPELLALAAGINPDLFYAQYVGIELTRVTSDGFNLKPHESSLFGLIDYSNPEIPVATESGYNFHVASLTVVFENSRIKDFSAEILLVVEKLFEEPARLLDSRTNIISLIGVAEEHNGKMTYSFGFRGSNRFKLSGNAFEEIEILKAQFVTDPIPDLNAEVLKVVGRFIFWSRIRFAYLDQFDILSFGRTPGVDSGEPDYLSVSNMQIEMAFDLVKDATTRPVSTFTFNPNQMAFDLEKSGWRGQSLYEKFPLIFREFLVGKADGSIQQGYMNVNNPLNPVELGKNGIQWYGMSFSINMESSEDLGTKAKIKADIMVGWNAGQKGTFVGLRFPGTSGTDKSLTIVGILKLVFKSIRFVVYPLTREWDDNGNKLLAENTERQVGYLLNLKNIRLEFFVLSFPPTGRTEITLFGDPTEGIDREKRQVGWYAAYVKK